MEILLRRRAEAERIGSRWLFPAETATGHIEKSSLRKQHARACRTSGVEPFVLYTLRHTCLTRWAEHMDPFTLMYLAGHESMETTKKYVHPQAETVHRAMRRVVGGHKNGHTVVSIDALQQKGKAVNS